MDDTVAPFLPCMFTHFCIPFSPVCYLAYMASRRQSKLTKLLEEENLRLRPEGIEWVGIGNWMTGFVLQWHPTRRPDFEAQNPSRRRVSQEPVLLDCLPPEEKRAEATVRAKAAAEARAQAQYAPQAQYPPPAQYPQYPPEGPPQQQMGMMPQQPGAYPYYPNPYAPGAPAMQGSAPMYGSQQGAPAMYGSQPGYPPQQQQQMYYAQQPGGALQVPPQYAAAPPPYMANGQVAPMPPGGPGAASAPGMENNPPSSAPSPSGAGPNTGLSYGAAVGGQDTNAAGTVPPSGLSYGFSSPGAEGSVATGSGTGAGNGGAGNKEASW